MAATSSGDHSPPSYQKNVRPSTASFGPNMWGDIFTSFSLDDQVQEKYLEGIQALKDEARSMLRSKGKTVKDKLVLIDTVERLGVAYHFEKEIEEQLQEIFIEDHQHCDFFFTALQFRLLRQHRHPVSSHVFDKFRGEEKKFKESDVDAKGLLSLYEAAQVRVYGEEILEEAAAFTAHHLKRMVQELESPLQDQVKRALIEQYSLHRGFPRLETHHYISLYDKDQARNDVLLKLAKLDYNYLQNIYKKELSELFRWWNEFDLKSKLPFSRDRVVESYIWGLGFHFEPQYSFVRTQVAKAVQMVTTMDDTYDNYATVEEADLFTQTLQRWNEDEIGSLPDYMKILYRFILSIYDDYERDAAQHGKVFAVPHAIEAVKQLCRAYSKDIKWSMRIEMPAFEDYLKNSIITTSIYIMFMASVPGLKSASKETIDLLMSAPQMIIASAKTGRLLDDMATHERESRQGETITIMDCYMKQHGVSKEEALQKFLELVEDGWKDVNREWIDKTSIPKEMMEEFLNFARTAEIFYKNCDDGFTNPGPYMGSKMIALLVDPIII